ncbi:MAG: DUF3326 domain-containing protein [Planctomycetaceae bacterium]
MPSANEAQTAVLNSDITINERALRTVAPETTCPQEFLDHLQHSVASRLGSSERLVRFVVADNRTETLNCELGVISGSATSRQPSPFKFRRRSYSNNRAFNAVFLIPTGIGAELGGHSGDAGPVARLLGSCCDHLITHPNVGNAADINELPSNAHYVEGSIITDLMMGSVCLQPVRSNRVLLLMEQHPDPWFMDATVNMASAARAAAGIHITEAVVLPRNFSMRSEYSESGRAAGVVEGLDVVYDCLRSRQGTFDAVAVASLIKVPSHYHRQYFDDSRDEMVNPWGGVEAMLTHAISRDFRIPAAHAPMMTSRDVQTMDFGPVDPRKAAEPVSATYLFSVLKGLHRSPRILPPETSVCSDVLSAENLHCLVIPDGCIGLPTLAALAQGIPVISVRGNRNCLPNQLAKLPGASDGIHFVDNYLEAAGLLMAMKAGVSRESVVRPIAPTKVVREQNRV